MDQVPPTLIAATITVSKPESGIPAWIHEALPAWFIARPQTTEAIWAAAVSAWYGISAVTFGALVAAYADGQMGSFSTTISYVGGHWWPYAVANLIIPAIRARQAAAKVAQKGP